MSGHPHGYRRATDLLNHVAYISSCTTSPTAAYTSSPPMFLRMGSSGQRRPSSIHSAIGTASDAIGVSRGGRGAAVAVNARSNSSEGIRNSCRRSSEDVFGSSPASTNTGTSLDDDPHSPSPCWSLPHYWHLFALVKRATTENGQFMLTFSPRLGKLLQLP